MAPGLGMPFWWQRFRLPWEGAEGGTTLRLWLIAYPHLDGTLGMRELGMGPVFTLLRWLSPLLPFDIGWVGLKDALTGAGGMIQP